MQRMHCLREGHSPAGLHSTWKWELLLFGTITQAGPDLWIQHGKTLHCLVSTHGLGPSSCSYEATADQTAAPPWPTPWDVVRTETEGCNVCLALGNVGWCRSQAW